MRNVKYIDHTGDVGIIVQAASPGELFNDCAHAMFHFICPQNNSNETSIQHFIALAAPDQEQLLVNWLSELNYLFHTEQFLLSSVKIISITGQTLEAQISGARVNKQQIEILREIKAVTYHQLYVKKNNELWEAQVIFDI